MREMIEIDEDIRFEYSELSVGTELIEVDAFIEVKIEGSWHEIGHAQVIVDEDQQTAKWGDILIGSRNGKYKILDPERGRPADINSHPALRGRGIGSRVAEALLERLKLRGIHRVYGTISSVDDMDKVSRFWERLGFSVQDQRIEKSL